MIGPTLSRDSARRFYDLLGARYDWLAAYGDRATRRAHELLVATTGGRILDVGTGTGLNLAALTLAAKPDGIAIGLDISPVMLRLAHGRSGAPVIQADARDLPVRTGAIDRLFSAYLLDLIPVDDLPRVLDEFRRVLKPGGRMALVSLTEDRHWESRAVIGLWKLAYRVSPIVCGGCRPILLASLVSAAGFRQVAREVVSQAGVPSEVVVAANG